MTINIPTWLPELEKWKQLKYDGIMGLPPQWIPEPSKKKFNTARSIVFFGVEQEEYNLDEIKQRFDKLVNDKNYRLLLALMKDHKPYDEDLFYLVELYDATLLGEIEGLRILGGDNAVMGSSYRKEQSNRGKKPRKLTETHKRNIRNKYIQAQNEGSVYGVVKALSVRYDVTERQIHNVVKDLIKK